jgi:NAD(P)-dependent dehydrogenase (short-subunit alcohol dehydrogenase family)
VTGAASGIGAAVAATLREQKCHVVLADLSSTSSSSSSSSIVETTNNENEGVPRIRYEKCDVTDPQQVQQLVSASDAFAAAVSPDQPRATILVNCAGITRDALLQDMTLEAFDEVINVNLRGTYLTCRAFLDPSRRKNTDPNKEPTIIMNKLSIVNIGSVVSEWGNVGQVNYAASKGGVVGLTRAIAREMTFRGEMVGRCNAVLPGFISTQMTDAVPSKIRESFRKKIPLGTFGEPHDVANLVAFLCSSQRSGYMTGQCIKCDGMISL